MHPQAVSGAVVVSGIWSIASSSASLDEIVELWGRVSYSQSNFLGIEGRSFQLSATTSGSTVQNAAVRRY